MSMQDITAYGAVGDGRTLCTRAIQEALDAAGRAGGGKVVVPPGTFLTGTIALRSGVTLDIGSGARLLGSPRIEDYPETARPRQGDRHRHHLVVADGVEHVTITGGGTIDGAGPAFWHPPKGPRTWIGARTPRVSPMLDLRACRDLRILDVAIENSPGWTVHLLNCDGVWVRGVRLRNHLFGPNTDGFDVNGCSDVMISDSLVECGDDAIVLKTTRDAGRPCERVVVTNCVIRTHCVAFKLGTESWHDMRQIAFSNSVVHHSTRAVGLYCLDGGTLEDIAVTGIVCDTDSGFILNRPLTLDLRKRDESSRLGRIRNVRFSDILARTDGRLLLTAADGGGLENITLRDVHLEYPAIDDPGPTGAGARSGQFANRSPEARVARAAVVVDQARNLVVENLTIGWPDGRPAGPWWSGPKSENGSDRQYSWQEAGAEPPGMHVLWGRGLRGGLIRAALARPSRDDVERYVLQDSDIRLVE